MVSAEIFSNTGLRCSALSWQTCYFGPVTLTWHHRNRILRNSTKYTITEEHKTNECKGRRLKAESILEISNVTDEDAGEYFCQLYCDFVKRNETDSIKLVAFVKTSEKNTLFLHFTCLLLFRPLILNDVFYAVFVFLGKSDLYCKCY